MTEEEVKALEEAQSELDIPEGWFVLWCPYRDCLTSLMFTRALVDSLPTKHELFKIQDECMMMLDHKGSHKGLPASEYKENDGS